MDDKTRKTPQETNELKDLPPKNLGKEVDQNVKGGSEPVNDLKSRLPSEPVNGLR